MKNERQSLILRLINEKQVETQKDITDILLEKGYKVTQATVSRDIKELHITKVQNKDGSYRYIVTPDDTSVESGMKFRSIFRESVLSVDYAGNIIVLKTLPGVANAAAIAVESKKLKQIVGSLAGDDTIFLVVRTPESAELLCNEIKEMLN